MSIDKSWSSFWSSARRSPERHSCATLRLKFSANKNMFFFWITFSPPLPDFFWYLFHDFNRHIFFCSMRCSSLSCWRKYTHRPHAIVAHTVRAWVHRNLNLDVKEFQDGSLPATAGGPFSNLEKFEFEKIWPFFKSQTEYPQKIRFEPPCAIRRNWFE